MYVCICVHGMHVYACLDVWEYMWTYMPTVEVQGCWHQVSCLNHFRVHCTQHNTLFPFTICFLKTKIFFFFTYYVCVYMCRLANNPWRLVLSFYHVGPKLELRCSGLVADIFTSWPILMPARTSFYIPELSKVSNSSTWTVLIRLWHGGAHL